MARRILIIAVLCVAAIVRNRSYRGEQTEDVERFFSSNSSTEPLLEQAMAKVDSKIEKSQLRTVDDGLSWRERWAIRIKKLSSFLSWSNVKAWFTKVVTVVGTGMRQLVTFISTTFKQMLLVILKKITGGQWMFSIIRRAQFAFSRAKDTSVVSTLKVYWNILKQVASADSIRNFIKDAFRKIIVAAKKLVGSGSSFVSIAEVKNSSVSTSCSADVDDDEPSLLEYGVRDPVMHDSFNGSTSLLETEENPLVEAMSQPGFDQELAQTLEKLKKSKFNMLIVSAVIDLLGISGVALDLMAFLGQATGVAWGPIQGLFIATAYDGANVMGMLSTMEEMLPYTEVVPSCFISWLLSYNDFVPAGLMRKVLHLPDRSNEPCAEEVRDDIFSKYSVTKDERNGHLMVRCFTPEEKVAAAEALAARVNKLKAQAQLLSPAISSVVSPHPNQSAPAFQSTDTLPGIGQTSDVFPGIEQASEELPGIEAAPEALSNVRSRPVPMRSVSMLQRSALEQPSRLLSCRRNECGEELGLKGYCFLQCSGWSDCKVVAELECP